MNDTVKIITSDDVEFVVSVESLKTSTTLRNLMDDLADANEDLATTIPLPNLDSAVFAHMVVWMDRLAAKARTDGKSESEAAESEASDKMAKLPEWEETYFKKLNLQVVFDIMLAANYLDVNYVLTCCAKYVASLITGKTPEQIRKTFNIKNDFTPDEEAQVLKENEWAMQEESVGNPESSR
jgi:S-phase kinase-associated protein 1